MLERQNGQDRTPPNGGPNWNLRQPLVHPGPRGVAPQPNTQARQPQRFALFAGVTGSDLAIIFAAARERCFERQEVLFLEGSPMRRVILLSSGMVKITQVGISGMEVILRLNGPGDMICAPSSLTRITHSESAKAIDTCRAVLWDVPVFDGFLDRFPMLQRNFCKLLEDRLQNLTERFREVATERVHRRVANELVRLVRRLGRPVDGAVEIALSREELAQMTGTTLFTVSRLLSEWQGIGAVLPRRQSVLVRNVEVLLAHVNAEPTGTET
ncbi:MAG: Crp/Fnr family transcriptional regulator [Acidobacteria bacterium]|nr:Crp/Fnr family transcriptional regulator [Acidobacteriota bacterium]